MKLVCVVGPTGCGKTWLGVELAKMLGGEVVSCDSMQIYRGMAIGTAAPTAEEMQGIPHHMVGVADPRENYSVARYADDAAKCVDDILSRGKQPVIVGGTGLYLNALLAGHGFAGGDKDGRYRAELESRWDKEGGEAMFVELRRIDPETAGNLHLNDKKRILRALEVYYETGKTMAQHNAETKLIPPRYESVRIGLAYEDRDDMKRAIDLRVDNMVEAGLGVSFNQRLISRKWSGTVAEIPFDPPQFVTLGISVPSLKEASPAAKKFIACAIETVTGGEKSL